MHDSRHVPARQPRTSITAQAPRAPGRARPAGRILLAASAGLCLAATLIAGTAAAAATKAARLPQVQPGQADHWGFFFGDVRKGGGDQRLVPTAIQLPGTVAEVGSSNSTQYALLTNGTLWAWGEGNYGELGDGRTSDSFDAAVQVQFPPGVKIASIPTDAMPYDTGLAVDTHGNAWGWGDNHGGSLCLGNAQPHYVPVKLPLTDVTALAGADGHAVYDAGGRIESCGDNTYGVLGDGKTRSSETPVPVSGLADQPVQALVSSWNDAGALLDNGEYYDWGYNDQGQLGDGTVGPSSSVPVAVRLPYPGRVIQVAQGGSGADNGQTVVMLSDGSLYAWGDDNFSQLGDGGTGERPSPVQIEAPFGVRYAVLASGGATSYALTTSGDVYAWGAGKAGEVGDGSTRTAMSPVEVATGATVISSTAGDVVVADASQGRGGGRPG
jgi:alpha-tubulin suppressor-like RCC1 family protein